MANLKWTNNEQSLYELLMWTGMSWRFLKVWLQLYSVPFALSGILVNKDGVPEEEENFAEAIKAVNLALVPTKVR